ncbi:MAG: DUF2339 domain-containing protein [bacterium]|nr:DUF2339 domain-containing protein [bacterium]
MYFLALLLSIVAIAAVMRQNARIDALEKYINGGKPIVTPSGQSTTSARAQVQAATTTAPASPTATIPVSKPILTPKQSEENSGKLLGKIGIAAVLVGMAYFLKYAFDNNWIGYTGRVMIGILVGVAFIAIGQYLRKKYTNYSDMLMGGGSAILYLSIFSAYAFYNIISAPTAGLLMFCVVALTFAISIYNATISLALIGIIGGFAVPFLVNSNENIMMVLFMYMTILNLGVLGISFFKKWPKLNVASFVGTVINFAAWYGDYYNSAVMGPVLLFCFVTFLIFLVASVARGVTAGIKADESDYILMGANAFVFAGIAYALLDPQYSHVLGFGAVFIAAIYIVIAFLVNKANPEDKALNIFLPGLAVVFLSIAVPLQFNGEWVAVAWMVESIFLYGIASMISNRGFQVMGVIVYSLGLGNFLIWSLSQFGKANFVPIFNSTFAILILGVVIAYVIAYMYKRFGSTSTEIQLRGIMVFVVIANILTIYGLSSQIILYHQEQSRMLSVTYNEEVKQAQLYSGGYDNSVTNQQVHTKYFGELSKLRNQSNTLVSILWTLYAAALTGIGFARRISSARRLGLALFIITAIKVLFDIWSLGQLYRVISLIGFGVIALVASFAYAKYKDRLKAIV